MKCRPSSLCPGEDLNLHPVKDTPLKRARLPIPPPGLVDYDYTDHD